MNPWLLKNIVFPAYHGLKKTSVIRRMRELEDNQWKTPEELSRLQSAKLERLLRHAHASVPFYRDRFDALGIPAGQWHSPGWFSRIPILEKQDITENAKGMISGALNGNRAIPNSTSGSTGDTLHFFYDTRSAAYRRATVIRNQSWLGIGLGDRAAKLWGAPMDLQLAAALRGRVHGWMNNLVLLSSYDLSDETLRAYEEKLNRFQPALLTSYPGPLAVFAAYLLKHRKTISSLKAIISSAETLYPWQKDIIEKAFPCPVFNRYGCREFGDIAQECSHRQGLHLNTDRCLVEILDRDMRPVANGGTGEVVVTDLDNYAMPMIRYRIGDLAALGGGPCACGRGLPLLKTVAGRTLDVVTAPNGNRLGGTFWTLLFRSRPGIGAFQVRQDEPGGITVRYVRDHRFTESVLGDFRGAIREKCGDDFGVDFAEVPAIEKTASGKTRFVISTIRQPQ